MSVEIIEQNVADTASPIAIQTPTRRRIRWPDVLLAIVFIGIAVVTLIPFWAIFVGTFQDGTMLMRNGLNLGLDLETASLRNFRMLFTDSGQYFTWFRNSVLVTVLQTVFTLLVSSFVAYGFAKYNFRFKTALFVIVVLLMTVPLEMMMLPLFTQMHDLGLSNTYWALLLPFLAAPMTIFFFRQYLQGIPNELIEAGRVDGVSEFGIFFRLVLPLMKPAMAAMAILNGMLAWNSFLWPLIVLRSPSLYTLPVGLNTLLTPYGNNYDLLIVGSFLALFPILILFLLFQKFFISGMTAGAVKG